MNGSQNVGKIDQYIRYFLAFVFLILSFSVSYWFIILTVIALITASTKVCPLYLIFKIKSFKSIEKE
ncbi:MAG: DUF2892 domain-containing protein [Acholeplasmataceae bacterium]|nr:DUF2892 domain-containing protein [Acholeplasmataceae bacterium]